MSLVLATIAVCFNGCVLAPPPPRPSPLPTASLTPTPQGPGLGLSVGPSQALSRQYSDDTPSRHTLAGRVGMGAVPPHFSASSSSVFPGYGGTQRLPRLVGRGAALRLLLTGDMIDATEAHRLGLVDQVTTPEALITTVRALLTTMLANAPLAIAGCIEAVNRGQDVPLEEGCTIESDFFGLLSSTADMKEGMRAFLEKRPPQFTGR